MLKVECKGSVCDISIYFNLKIWSLKPLRWAEDELSQYDIFISKLKPSTWSEAEVPFPKWFPPPEFAEFGFFLCDTPPPPPPLLPLVIYCGSDNVNGLCPTWSSECIVPLLADPRSVWCVKSIYLNLFACIGIWQRASCFHLMFFVLNTDKQACFCTPLSSGLFSFQPIFYSVDFSERSRNVLPF